MDAQENTNLYHPDNETQDAQVPSRKTAKDSNISWSASEYIEHQRGAGWYMLLVLSTIVISGGTYLLIKDYFAMAMIIIVGIIVGVFAGHKPEQVTYEISDSEIKIGPKSYDYGSFKSFSIIHDGLLTSLTLYPLKRLMPPISAYFDAKDEDRIAAMIGDRLPLEEGRLDRIEQLSRRLKL